MLGDEALKALGPARTGLVGVAELLGTARDLEMSQGYAFTHGKIKAGSSRNGTQKMCGTDVKGRLTIAWRCLEVPWREQLIPSIFQFSPSNS